MEPVTWSTLASAEVDADLRGRLRTLWDDAFDGRFSDDDADHAYGGVHVVGLDPATIPLAHASVVPRRLRVGETWHDAGYVEAVAVACAVQGRGLGSVAMRRLQEEIARRHRFAMLSTGSHGFYERLGWQRWQGRSLTLGADGVARPDDEHGGIMVLDPAAALDLTADVVCEDRPGDAW